MACLHDLNIFARSKNKVLLEREFDRIGRLQGDVLRELGLQEEDEQVCAQLAQEVSSHCSERVSVIFRIYRGKSYAAQICTIYIFTLYITKTLSGRLVMSRPRHEGTVAILFLNRGCFRSADIS